MNRRKLFAVSGGARRVLAAASLAIIMVGASAIGAQAADSTWTVAKSANVTLPGGKIESVSCSAPTACTAVGTDVNTSGINVTLAERWNGASWQRQATPNPPPNTNPQDPTNPALVGVSCPSASFCVAVGNYQSGFFPAGIVQTWDGQRWTSQSFPVPSDDSSGLQLTGVSCT
jgi:hypothetical protein